MCPAPLFRASPRRKNKDPALGAGSSMRSDNAGLSPRGDETWRRLSHHGMDHGSMHAHQAGRGDQSEDQLLSEISEHIPLLGRKDGLKRHRHAHAVPSGTTKAGLARTRPSVHGQRPQKSNYRKKAIKKGGLRLLPLFLSREGYSSVLLAGSLYRAGSTPRFLIRVPARAISL